MQANKITDKMVQDLYERLRREAQASGYHLNPDDNFVKELIRGLLANEARYGYQACPCRLASGKKDNDLDIICPCDYRDTDLARYGMCYCALYVSGAIAKGEKSAESIPDRRPPTDEIKKTKLPYTVWRCKVCGYLCARDEPPEVCPICKAKKERFEQFI